MADSSKANIDANVDSSPAEDNNADVNLDSSPNQDVNAESSTAEEGKKELNSLEVVERVLNPEKPKEEKTEESEEAEDKADVDNSDETEKADEGEADAEKEEEEKNPPFHEHPRWKQVVKERDTFKAEVETMRVGADRSKKLDTYFEENSITPEQASTSLEVAALINNGMHEEALKILAPVYEQLNSLVGNTLPEDLQEKVDNGYIDEDTAREVAQNRTTVEVSKQNAQRFQERATKREAEIAVERSNKIVESVEAFAATLKKSDPDYSKKEDLMLDRVTAELSRKGSPTTAEGAREMVKEAHGYVTKYLSSALPKRRESGVSPKNVRTGTARIRPKTAMEAVDLALQK